MKKHFYLFLVSFLALSFVALADNPPGFGGGSPDPIPADGGLSILAVSGGMYAYRKLRARRADKAKKA
jgi:hypothetical protein